MRKFGKKLKKNNTNFKNFKKRKKLFKNHFKIY